MNGFQNPLFPQLRQWISLQEGMTAVIRWGKYRKVYPKVRRQTNAEHTLAILWSALVLLPLIKQRHPNFDGELFLAAVLCHDFGEGVRKLDVDLKDKTSQQDVDEYLAYAGFIKELDPASKAYALRAFLLQQVEKNWEGFPPEAIEVLKELKATRPLESKFIRGLEYYDYACSAMAHPAEHAMLIWVLRNGAAKLNQLADDEPSFRQIVWTLDHSRWAEDLLQEYEFLITEDDAVEEARLRALG